MRLGSGEFKEEFGGRGLVDCAAVGHPSMIVEADIEALDVPTQFLAPEVDEMFTAEMKLLAFTSLQKRGVPFDYQHFPGVAHGCLQRGNGNIKGERAAMVRGHNALVAWFKQWLQ
jgi:dienelactone hydrolase